MMEYKKRARVFTITKTKTDIPVAKIHTSKDASEYIKKYLYGPDIEVYESVWILLLNRANNVTGFVKISQGGVSGTVMDTKLIAKYAIEELASSVILVHNHPSGNILPSETDKLLTTKIKNTLAIFDCPLIDHLILTGEDKYYSFADEGLL